MACQAFEWVGQPWSSCDGCGRPLWEHEQEYGVGGRAGKVIDVDPDMAERIRQQFAGTD